MAKSIKRNYFYNTVYSILTVITPLITAPYTSRVLEADGIGAMSFALSIVTYFTLFGSLGTWSYGSREIAYVRDDLEKRSIVFWEVVLFRVISTFIVLAVYLAAVYFYAKSYRILFFIFALNILTIACDVTWFFFGLEEFGKIVFRNIIIRIIDIAFVFAFIKSKSDLPLHAFGSVFFNVAGTVVMWKYLPAYIKKPDFKSLHPFRNIKTIFSLFIPGLAVQVYTVLDKTMIGIFTEGTFENGYYEQALKISKIVLALVTSLAGVMVPRIGYLFAKGDREQVSFLMYRSYKFVLCVSVALCFGLVGISDNFVPWFFGPGYEKVAGLLKVSSFLIVAIGLNNATGIQYFIPTKRQNLFTYSVVIGAAANFTMNIILIRMYQSYGAIIASVAAETLIAAIEFYFVRKEISTGRVILSGTNYYIAGGVMLAVLFFMGSRLTPSPVHTFTMIFTGAAVYVSLLFILRDKFFLEYSAKPLEFLKRKFAKRKG